MSKCSKITEYAQRAITGKEETEIVKTEARKDLNIYLHLKKKTSISFMTFT